MRHVAALAALLAVGCGSTRPIDVPPTYSDFGILVTVRPRVYTDWMLGFETLRGAAENRTGRDMDLGLYLLLLDDTGLVVGQAVAPIEDFRTGSKRSFEALVPHVPFARVKRGWIMDTRALQALIGGGG